MHLPWHSHTDQATARVATVGDGHMRRVELSQRQRCGQTGQTRAEPVCGVVGVWQQGLGQARWCERRVML